MQIAIVGAGLAGCVLASALSRRHHVTLYEQFSKGWALNSLIHDVGRPHGAEQLAGGGPGGSTQYWHNGLIIPEESVFNRWPLELSQLSKYYDAAFSLLSNVDMADYEQSRTNLTSLWKDVGVPETDFGMPLFYPARRTNASHLLRGAPVTLSIQEIEYISEPEGMPPSIHFRSADGDQRSQSYDAVVISAGGLLSPTVLSRSASDCEIAGGEHVGRHYEDHPMFFLGAGKVNKPIHRLWNYSIDRSGSYRLPLMGSYGANNLFSVYLRPLWQQTTATTRVKVKSILSDLRNAPFSLPLYGKLLANPDDLLELAALKLGIQLPSEYYSALVVCEQSNMSTISCRAAREYDPQEVGSRLVDRDWIFPQSDLAAASAAVVKLLGRSQLFDTFEAMNPDEIRPKSAAHHSGTCRMSDNSAGGVVNPDLLIHGCRRVYVCDGSVIPASGFANTGLTITALALRLAGHLNDSY